MLMFVSIKGMEIQIEINISTNCFYNERYKIERTNAWMDSFRSLLNRFDTTIESWLGFNYLVFIIIALKKFNKIKV